MSEKTALEEVLELAEEVLRLAEENPDYVYFGGDSEGGRCYYSKSKNYPEKGCLLGQALENTGVISRERLVEHDKNPRTFGVLLSAERPDLDYRSSHQNPDMAVSNIIYTLADIQRYQDSKDSWGHAVEIAQLKGLIEQCKMLLEKRNQI